MSTTLAERLKAKREEKGISMSELARQIGCSQAFVSYFENGFKTPSVTLLKRIADVLDCSADYLIGRADK